MSAAAAKKVFTVFDADGSGTISGSEIVAALRAAHATSGAHATRAPTADAVNELMREYDKDRSGEIDLAEFTAMVLHMATSASASLSALEQDVLSSAIVLMERSETGKVAMMSVQALRTIVPIGLCMALIAAASSAANPAVRGGGEPLAVHATMLTAAHMCSATSIVAFVAIVVAHCRKAGGLRDARNQLVLSICAMVPLYAVASNIKLHLRGEEHVLSRQLLDAAKECYEAVVLYDFLELMYSYAGITPGKALPKELLGRRVHFGPPVDWFWASAKMNEKLVRTLEAWTLQYVVLMPLLVTLHIFGPHVHGGHGSSSSTATLVHWGSQAVFMTSTTLSLSALIGFYHTFAKEIATYSPFAKLICIKLVVALCFWQSLVVPVVGDHLALSATFQEQLNDVLVCVEMGMLFSFAFVAAYWLRAGRAPPPSCGAEREQKAAEKKSATSEPQKNEKAVGATSPLLAAARSRTRAVGAAGTPVATKVAEEKVEDEAPATSAVKAKKTKKRRTRKSAD